MNKEVYSQSAYLTNEVLHRYYLEGMTQYHIAQELAISKPTVSRMIRNAEKEGMVRTCILLPYRDCRKLQGELSELFPGTRICVVPVFVQDRAVLKQAVAIEGARHVQRHLEDNQVLGIAWGGTIHDMIQALNPCQKKNISVVALHGEISECGGDYDVDELVRRAAMSLGGRKVVSDQPGYFPSEEALQDYRESESCRKIRETMRMIDMAVVGAGCWFPRSTSPLTPPVTDYLSREEYAGLQEKGVAADLLLHYIDRAGKEIESPIRNRTLSIDLEAFRNIPEKIALLSGEEKVAAACALLRGGYADVLYLDYWLARKLFYSQRKG